MMTMLPQQQQQDLDTDMSTLQLRPRLGSFGSFQQQQQHHQQHSPTSVMDFLPFGLEHKSQNTVPSPPAFNKKRGGSPPWNQVSRKSSSNNSTRPALRRSKSFPDPSVRPNQNKKTQGRSASTNNIRQTSKPLFWFRPAPEEPQPSKRSRSKRSHRGSPISPPPPHRRHQSLQMTKFPLPPSPTSQQPKETIVPISGHRRNLTCQGSLSLPPQPPKPPQQHSPACLPLPRHRRHHTYQDNTTILSTATSMEPSRSQPRHRHTRTTSACQRLIFAENEESRLGPPSTSSPPPMPVWKHHCLPLPRHRRHHTYQDNTTILSTATNMEPSRSQPRHRHTRTTSACQRLIFAENEEYRLAPPPSTSMTSSPPPMPVWKHHEATPHDWRIEDWENDSDNDSLDALCRTHHPEEEPIPSLVTTTTTPAVISPTSTADHVPFVPVPARQPMVTAMSSSSNNQELQGLSFVEEEEDA
eukprot:CAMPEP_0172472044 /NCGR_PEP_ID=MMETSP1065-20121228/68131_1 /TAXON_ID=265537 /ORGANISM="Amphiprora paludosa, Strain CCMP125" /LENGTH=468 /DNA_ID=CAMNT_0013230161 /DNA_START=111 /DNA_END=1517 /DNA_ORIENTATION=-